MSGSLKISGSAIISLKKYQIYENNLKRRKAGVDDKYRLNLDE